MALELKHEIEKMKSSAACTSAVLEGNLHQAAITYVRADGGTGSSHVDLFTERQERK